MSQSGINYLVIDSLDRTKTSASSTDCKFNIYPGLIGCHGVELLSLVIPMTQYNINSTNNIVYFNDGANKSVALAIGNYTSTTFPPMLQSALNSVSGIGFTVTYSDTLMMLTITAGSNWNYTFGTNTTNSANYILGANPVDTSPVTSITGPNAINLSLPLYFYVSVNEFQTNVKSSNNIDNGSFVFVNPVNSGDVLTFAENTDYKQRANVTESNIQTLTMRFINHNNQTLDINNANWSMILRMIY